RPFPGRARGRPAGARPRRDDVRMGRRDHFERRPARLPGPRGTRQLSSAYREIEDQRNRSRHNRRGLVHFQPHFPVLLPHAPETIHMQVCDSTLVIVAKAPRPGLVKTRLSACLPPAAILGLYRCLLEDTLDLARSLDGVEAAIMCPTADIAELS